MDDSINHQRELIRESEIEVLKCKQALSIAESVREGRLGALAELLDLKKAQEKNNKEAPHLVRGEHNTYPTGRAAAI
jgi:hypothetical protein